MQLIDVTVPLGPHLPVYPGNTPFSLEPIKRIASGGSSNVSSLRMSVHSGTHVDAPRHFFDEGATVEALSLDLLVGPARVIDLFCLPLSIPGADGAPARVLLGRRPSHVG